MQQELKNCPFCGGHARPMTCEVGVKGTMGHNRWTTITCSMCEINNGGKGGFMRPRYDTEQEAATAWNTRAPLPMIDGLEDSIEGAEHDYRVGNTVSPNDFDDIIKAARAYAKLQANITKKGE